MFGLTLGFYFAGKCVTGGIPEDCFGQTAAAFFDLKLELEALFNRPVDLITKASLTNPYFRQSVLTGQRELYAA